MSEEIFYPKLYSEDISVNRHEIRALCHRSEDWYIYFKETINRMHRYGVSPYTFEEIVNGLSYTWK